MQYGKIENYKIIGTCLKHTEDFPDEIPDEAQLFDFYVNGTLYPNKDHYGKIPIAEEDGKLVWSDDVEVIRQNIKLEIAGIDAQIIAIETTQPRQIREITLGLDTDGTAKAKLAASNTEISALREQRATLKASIKSA